ncbi:M48 family metalloprotease [Natrinema sp. SYSU A 869]|uniref:M48 family metallopeptidase n=1 Tax=Natrinema sp. SYSU A 869 TaxID=2871694 RepID=UPI001CA45512|nr:M48 family metalloprotease [Natrinema sp. SYSU A 869]
MPNQLLDWTAIAALGGILGLLTVAWWIPRTIRNERRYLLEKTRHVAETDAVELEATVRRLATQFDVPTPALRVQPINTPVAYTTSRPAAPLVRTGTANTPVVVLSTGLIETVSPAELEAILAHELAHIVNDDLRLITAILVPLMTAELLYEGTSPSDPLDLIGYLLATVAAIGVGVFSREVAADRAAAIVTGNPAQLAAALERLYESEPQRPSEDLRNHAQVTNAVNFVPTITPERTAGHLWSTHPSLETRIEELQSVIED